MFSESLIPRETKTQRCFSRVLGRSSSHMECLCQESQFDVKDLEKGAGKDTEWAESLLNMRGAQIRFPAPHCPFCTFKSDTSMHKPRST